MNSEKEFQHESVEDKDSIEQYLQSLAKGFRNRKLEFMSGEEKIALEPTGLIQVEIRAKNRHRKSKLSVKFTWKEERQGKKKRSLSLGADEV